MKPGDLVQIRKNVHGQGEVGVMLGPITADDEPQLGWYKYGSKLLKVMFHDGIRFVHPDNLQKPDGRTRTRC